MDPRLIDYYNRELQHLREMGGEFAKEFPRIAGRLGLAESDRKDPYVERLIEGVGFLAARVQLKIDSEFPVFCQNLLELIYPHYLAPTPSMAVVALNPDLGEGSLQEGVHVRRGSVLKNVIKDRAGRKTPGKCEFRTAHDVTLWPLELTEAEYLIDTGAFTEAVPNRRGQARAGIRLRLRTTAELRFDQLDIDKLPIYLRGSDALPMHIYEQLLANPLAMVVQPTARPSPWQVVIDKSEIRPVGFEEENALLPYGPRSFQGYRLLQEYFAFPQRYLFVELSNLRSAFRRCSDNEIDIVILLDRHDRFLENLLNASNFSLFCTPAINLFPKRADRIHLDNREAEWHIVPDRTGPRDYEVYSVTEVVGIGAGPDSEQAFQPFYANNGIARDGEDMAYFTLRRMPRVPSSQRRTNDGQTKYGGSEVYISLVDANDAPYRSDLRQLAVSTLCTNRHLPLGIRARREEADWDDPDRENSEEDDSDFILESGAPIASIRCVAGPTEPRSPRIDGETVWRLISHLSLNYLSLIDNDEAKGAVALRELLLLYEQMGDASVTKQIDGLRSVSSRPVTRRIVAPGPISFGRGLEITLTFDDDAFEGTGEFLLGAVLEQFFRRYVSLNSFTETVVKTVKRGEIMRWRPRVGRRQIL